jgi:hypothetical protein
MLFEQECVLGTQSENRLDSISSLRAFSDEDLLTVEAFENLLRDLIDSHGTLTPYGCVAF